MIVISLATGLICAIGVGLGFDPKRPVGWFFGLVGFMSGFTLGLTRDDWRSGVSIGIVATLLVLYGGYMTFLHKQIFKD